MAPRKKLPQGPVPVGALRHEDKRINIPTADSEELLDEEVARPEQLRWKRDPSLDPQLVWKGKDEQDGEDLVVEPASHSGRVPARPVRRLRRARGL
jgi:adenine-specific DNA-methyltransferase